MTAIIDIAFSRVYKNYTSRTSALICAANDEMGATHFNCTLSNKDGRTFAGGEKSYNVFEFVDLEDEDRTVYTLAELKALNTDQDWFVL